jgi:hypothetical protein
MRHVQFIGIEQFALLPFTWLFKNTWSEVLEHFVHTSVLTKIGLNAI